MRTRPLLLLSALSLLAATLRAQAPATPVSPPPAQTGPAVAPAPAQLADKPAAQDAPTAGGATTKAKDSSGKDSVSVDFRDQDIRDILSNVADLFEINLVMPETLQGKQTIKLRDVTWRQIFQNVLAPVNYTYIEEGNIIKIVSNESLTQEPVMTDVFLINYARASDILPTITTLVDATAGGKIVVDTRSNSLIISERPTRMSRIRPIIEQLDRATDQVMIETKFVEVTSADVKNIGVNWSSLANYQLKAGSLGGTFDRNRNQTATSSANTNGTNGRNAITGTLNGTNGTTLNGTNGTTTNGTTGSQTTGSNNTGSVTSNNGTPTATSTTGTNSSITNATTTGTTIGTTTGSSTGTTTTTQNDLTTTIGSTLTSLEGLANGSGTSRVLSAVFSASDFSLVLSALQTLQSSKIVSNPTIVTLNNTEAVINVGQERPIPKYAYNQQTGSFEVNGFDYKPIGIILKVTPQVNARGFIKLTVEPEVSQSTRDASFNGASIPVVDTRKAKTQVSLKDGFTMGIGGLITTQSTKGGNRIPVLGSIPVLGRLFRSDTSNMEQTNLIIFITAKTVNAEGAAVEQIFESGRVRELQMTREDLPGFRDGSNPFLPSVKPGEKPPEKKSFFRSSDSKENK